MAGKSSRTCIGIILIIVEVIAFCHPVLTWEDPDIFMEETDHGQFSEEPEVIITEEPHTDKSCYVVSDRGIMSVTYALTNASSYPDDYMVLWNTQQDGTGEYYIMGLSFSLYEDVQFIKRNDDRWRSTVTYSDRSVTFAMEVNDLWLDDDIGPVFALIYNRLVGQVVAVSKGTARFRVMEDCDKVFPSLATSSFMATSGNEEKERGGSESDEYSATGASDTLHKIVEAMSPIQEIQLHMEGIKVRS